MTTVHLHIGMPKCASSSLQAHFWGNYDFYRQQGVLYPRTACEEGGYRSHRPLHDAPLDEIPNLIAAIAAEAEQAGCDRILLSSEELLNSRWDRPVSAALIAALNAAFGQGNVRLLFLLRDPVAFLSSAFAQFIRGGLFRVSERDVFAAEMLGIEAYADAFKARNGFEVFNFSEFYRRFAGGDHGNAIDVLSLDRSEGGGGDIIEKTCRLLGVDCAPQQVETNQRLSERQLFCLLHARKRHGFSKVQPRRGFLIRGVGEGPNFSSPIFRPTTQLLERVTQAALQDQAFFQAQYGAPFDRSFRIQDDVDTGQQGRRMPGEKMVAFIDAIMTPEEMTPQEARAIRRRIFGGGQA